MPSKHWKEAAMYAEDMARYDRAWKYWQTKECNQTNWTNCAGAPQWRDEAEYRRRPRTIRIGEYDVPEPMREAPERNQLYYAADMCGVDSWQWAGDVTDLQLLEFGLCHSTKEAAELHAKALLSFTRRDE